jgi:hypothetical protein
MMHNSLDRLLDGIASTLRNDIAPQLSDPYVRAQAQTAAELLAHLAEHVEWRCDQLRAEIDAAVALLPEDDVAAALQKPPPVPPADTIVDNAALVEAHDTLLRAIARQPISVLDAFARGYHARELDRFAAARARIRAAR